MKKALREQRLAFAKFLATRILLSIFTLFCIATVTFILMKSIPGDPFQDEQVIPEACLKRMRQFYGLEDPMPTQYLRYIFSILTFDFGPSLKYSSQTVNNIIANGFPISALLGIEALLIAIPVGTFVGIFCALYRRTFFDKASGFVTVITLAAPTFLIATTLQFFLAFYIPIFPIACFETYAHTFLPALTLAFGPATMISKLLRASAIEVLNQPYILTAHMKGLPLHRIIFRHLIKNSFIPVLSYLGPVITNVLVGSFIVERVFAIPGLGQWLILAVLNRDYPVIGGITIFYSAILLAVHLLIDIFNTFLDPRIQLYARR